MILQQQCYVYIPHFPYFRRFRFFRSCCCFAAFHSVLLLVSVSMYRRLKRNTLDSCIRSELKESYVCFWVHIDMPICAPQWSWKWKDNSTKGAFRLMDAEMRNSEFILTGSEMPKDMVPSWWNNIYIFGICGSISIISVSIIQIELPWKRLSYHEMVAVGVGSWAKEPRLHKNNGLRIWAKNKSGKSLRKVNNNWIPTDGLKLLTVKTIEV